MHDLNGIGGTPERDRLREHMRTLSKSNNELKDA